MYVALHEVTWLYGVDRTCAETAAVTHGTSHASAVSTPLWWILKKTRYKKLVIHVESHVSAVSLLESGEQRYKSTSPGSKHQPKPSRHRLLLGHSPLAVCWALGTERRRRRLPQRQHPVALAPPGHQGSPAGVAVCGPASCTAVGAMEHRLKS